MAAYNLQRFHVLVVEDNEYIRETLTDLLTHLGVGRVTATVDGTSAIEELKRLEKIGGAGMPMAVDIIFSDMIMSPMNGLLFLRWVRTSKDSGNRFTPFVMVSGAADYDYVRSTRDIGVTEFLGKPFSVNSVSKRLLGGIDHPRQIVMSRKYFGPDRRRRAGNSPTGEERRTTSEDNITIVYSPKNMTAPKSGSQVWYFRLPNSLKEKAGGLGASGPGEFPANLLAEAEEQLERSAVEFTDWALDYLAQLSKHCDAAMESGADRRKRFEEINLLAHELRGQGGTFGYPLVTVFAKRLYDFTGEIETIDEPAVEVVKAHIDTLRVVIRGKISGDGGAVGKELGDSLEAAVAKLTG
ncbi:MAG: response regulator [Proteobacteria bacterium]|nr:response regulator [Pseudomonadota bacterium]